MPDVTDSDIGSAASFLQTDTKSTMSITATLWHVIATAYHLAVTLWHACIVFLQVMQSVMREAEKEATEVMALLDEGAPMMDAISSMSLLQGASGSMSRCEMLIIAKASSFVLLFRLSKRRVLHLEVDERFIATKLEVICTELMVDIQHVPRLLQTPIGMHDTRLVRYTPMKLPYVWKEEQAGPGCEDESAQSSIVPIASASPISAVTERRSRRKKCVQLLTESALRRRLHMDRLKLEGTPKRGVGKNAENMVKRKALENATNVGTMHAEGSTDGDGTSGETHGVGVGTPKQARMERNIHAALSENLSIPNMARKSIEGGPQSRRSSLQPARRKRGQFDLYAPRVSGDFSLVSRAQDGE